jgi:hypothetical protein
MSTRKPPKPRKFPAAKQRRLNELLDKNSEGTITAVEKARLEMLVSEAEQLTVANTVRLAEFSRSETGTTDAAVPVTVWVRPQHVEP